MTKENWLDSAVIFLQGGTNSPPELKVSNDKRVIEKFLSMAFDMYFNESSSNKDEINDEAGMYNWKYAQMTKRFIQPILKDPLTNDLYVELPKQIMSINNNQGIQSLSPTKEQSSVFFPRRLMGGFILGDLDVSTMGQRYYNLEGRNIYIGGAIDDCWESLLMKLAVKFEELDPTDFVNVPDGASGQIYQFMLQLMTNKLPSDITDDNVVEQNQK